MNKIIRVKPCIPAEDKPLILAAWKDILDTGMFIEGKYVSDFEKKFAAYCGTKYAIATSSGATALEVALRASGIEGKKILVPTQTFVASVSAIIRSGNIPVILDIDPLTQGLSFDLIKSHLDSDVAGVMLVHMAGFITPEYQAIKNLLDYRKVLLFEDASHAVGASIDGTKAGNLGFAGCFSLFSTKIITTGEGGVITTNDDDFAARCRVIKNHGSVRNEGEFKGLDYGVTCNYASSNYRMPEFAAALGVEQVKHIDEFVSRRNTLANRYWDKITNPKVSVMEVPKNIVMTWWQYIIVIEGITVNQRESICLSLLNQGVPTANAYWPACHTQPAFKKYVHGTFPVADDLLNRHIALPMHVELEIEQVDYISRIVNQIR
jgi:dTDP-4-amino-4,6-dideoxygalactose transaminase